MSSLARDLTQFIIAYFRWLASFRRAFIVLVPPVVALLSAVFLPGNPEDQIRRWGLALQLLGVGTVAFVLRGKATIFGRSVVGYFRQRFATRPRFRPPTQTLSAGLFVNSSTFGRAHLDEWQITAATDSLEERLSKLERNIEIVRKTLDRNSQKARQASKTLQENLNSERRNREESIAKIDQQLHGLGAGGLHIELAGVIWLAFGIVMATIPTELARLLGLEQ